MVAGFFLAVALGSYEASDPSLNSIGSTAPVKNQCGYIGSFLSDLLYQACGWGAWVFVLFAFYTSVQAFRRKHTVHLFKETFLIFILSVVAVSALFELHQPVHLSPFPHHILPGGLLGKIVIQSLTPYLHFTGLALLFWSLSFMLLMMYTKASVSVFFMNSVTMIQKICLICLSILWRYGIAFAKGLYNILVTYSKDTLYRLKTFLLSLTQLRSEPATTTIGTTPEEIPKQHLSYSFLEEENEDTTDPATDNETQITKQKAPPLESTTKSRTSKATSWVLPPRNLLSAPASNVKWNKKEMEEDAERLKKKLQQFSISGEITKIHSGPVITLFEFRPEDHVKVARVAQMEDDLMMALKSQSIRIIAPIPGRDVVGIETAHTHRQTVYLKRLLNEPLFWEKSQPLPLVLGRHVDGRPGIVNLRKIPHLMVAGSTGSGKSVFVISFLLGLLFRHSPKSLRLLLVDPKQVDLSAFDGTPHLRAPPIRESKAALSALQWCVREMNKRYRSLAQFQVRDLENFNQQTHHLSSEQKKKHEKTLDTLGETTDYYFSPQPYICIVLEEFGDLMSSPDRNQIESTVVRLAQMARACGIHLILSMQSPRKDVVTGLIKTNIPGRISFKVSSRVDSRIILDEGGAERLLAQGDMLYLGPGQARAERYHGPFVKEKEVLDVVKFWSKQSESTSYPVCISNDTHASDPLHSPSKEQDETYAQIFQYVSALKEVSTSHLQRKYGLGYPRAARLIDQLEAEGVIGPARGSKPRRVQVGN